jgi:hypothetical protein
MFDSEISYPRLFGCRMHKASLLVGGRTPKVEEAKQWCTA